MRTEDGGGVKGGGDFVLFLEGGTDADGDGHVVT